MPISYEHLMHCLMRAEERQLAWISWGPFAQYHNPNKKGWEHEAVRYSNQFEKQLERFGIDLDRGPKWPGDGSYRLQCVWGDGFLAVSSDQPWSNTQIVADSKNESTIWNLERIDGNIYRLKSSRGEDVYLHGDFENEETWRDVQTAESHPEWNSQKFQLLAVSGNVFQIKCLWGDLYLTGRNASDAGARETNIRTAPLNSEWTSQHWRLVPVTGE